MARYAANRLRVVRQVRYSLHNENCIDLVLFLNGMPVATVELKTDFTQSISDAVDQYRFDRIPQPKGQARRAAAGLPARGAGALRREQQRGARWSRGCNGPATAFLPFNQGDDGGSGQPAEPAGGHRTAYLWEQVWERESWLEILGRYLVAKRDSKKQIERIIFPRYHQLDATRKLQAAVLAEGPGRKYLIQHSAGLGQDQLDRLDGPLPRRPARCRATRSCSTACWWSSDRNVIDAQLAGGASSTSSAPPGVVATITGERRQQERRAGRGAVRRQEDRRLHHPDLPLRAGGRAGAGGHRRASASP
ncbi:MAG: type I restriction endonuclease [Rhodoblastus sp.]